MALQVNNLQEFVQSTLSLVLRKLQSTVNQAFTLAPQILSSVQQTTSSFRFYPPEAVQQFNEMVFPLRLPEETNFRLVTKEIATSVAFVNKLCQVSEFELIQFLNVIAASDCKNAPQDSILFSPKLPHIAFEALRLGLLDPKYGPFQVATVLQWWSALQYHKDPSQLQTISILDPRAEGYIRQTLLHSKETDTELFLEQEKFDHFIEKVKKLPPSEQQFLLVPDIHGALTPEEIVIKTGSPLLATISQATRATGINVFNRLVDHLGNPVQMIASTGMKQAFVETQYGEDAVIIKPKIYLSTVSHVTETRLSDTADMMVPTPDEEGNSRCPKMADGYLAPWYEFPQHDFYHVILTSAVGKTYRKVGVQIAHLIREFAGRCPAEQQKGLRQLAFTFIDMDYIDFHHFSLSEEYLKVHALWRTVNRQLMAHRHNVESFQAYEELGITLPNHAYPISEENEVKVFEIVYRAFVVEKKGPAEITKESFQYAALPLLDELDENFINGALDEEAYNAQRCAPIFRFLDQLDDESLPRIPKNSLIMYHNTKCILLYPLEDRHLLESLLLIQL